MATDKVSVASKFYETWKTEGWANYRKEWVSMHPFGAWHFKFADDYAKYVVNSGAAYAQSAAPTPDLGWDGKYMVVTLRQPFNAGQAVVFRFLDGVATIEPYPLRESAAPPAERPGKYPIDRPCSACTEDPEMERHDHTPPFRKGYGPPAERPAATRVKQLLREVMATAVRLAITRHNLELDPDTATEEEIAADAAGACFGEECCDDKPLPEVTELLNICMAESEREAQPLPEEKL